MKILKRRAAIAAGLKRYFTGKPCKNGHIAERKVAERMCIECLKARSAADRVLYADYFIEYRKAHREKAMADAKLRYAENADLCREYSRKYREANAEVIRLKDRARASSDARKESRVRHYAKHGHKARSRESARYQRERDSIKARVAKYRAGNPDKVREQRRPGVSAARARKKAAEGKFTKADVRRLFDQQGGVCAACPSELGCNYHVDHMTPLSRGGSNWPSNLQLLCQPCNLSKGKKTMAEWLAWKAEVALAVTLPDRRAGLALPMASDRPLAPRS